VESTEELYQAELDADEAQDEILSKGGIYPMPFRRDLLSKILVIIGVPILVLGLLFWYQIGGLRFPNLSFVGAALMPLLSIFLAVLGLGCLVAGVALAVSGRRDPYEMRPIR